MMAKISKRAVDVATPKKARCYLWDDEIKGFGLQVLPTGVKSYVYQYRTPEGRTRRATLGKHGPSFTAAQAREKAKGMRRVIEDGGDPLGEKKARREAMTVKQVLDAYIESARFSEKAPSTQAIDRGRINRHLAPTLGKKFVQNLTTEDVRRAFAAIRDGKTAVNEKTGFRGRAIVKGGEGTARSAVRLLRAVLTWALSEGMCTANPAQGVHIGADGNRNAILTSDEYKTLFTTIEAMENERRIRGAVADAIRVIALTAARRGEITGLKWSHVSLKDGVLELPPAAHKTGRKTGKPRIIGLPTTAQAIIARQSDGEPDDYVFPPSRGDGTINLSKPWRSIREEAGLPEGIGLHGLRHSLASHMAIQGAQAAEIMETLGHRQLSTAQRYIHWNQNARAALAERASAHIAAALGGEESNVEKIG